MRVFYGNYHACQNLTKLGSRLNEFCARRVPVRPTLTLTSALKALCSRNDDDADEQNKRRKTSR